MNVSDCTFYWDCSRSPFRRSIGQAALQESSQPPWPSAHRSLVSSESHRLKNECSTAIMPSNVPTAASDGEPPRPVRGDSPLPMDAEDLEHIREEKEQELLEGPASPTPASAINGETFMGNLMSPLLTQAPVGPSASDASLDEGNASRTSPPTLGM